MADYFSSSDDDAQSFYGFLEEEINPRYLANFQNEEIAVESDIDLGEISGAGKEDESDEGDEGEGVGGLDSNEDLEIEATWTRKLTSNNQFLPFVEAVGPTAILEKEAKELDLFNQMFPEELYVLIASETNKYAMQKRHPPMLPDKNWVPTTAEEIKLYLGIRL